MSNCAQRARHDGVANNTYKKGFPLVCAGSDSSARATHATARNANFCFFASSYIGPAGPAVQGLNHCQARYAARYKIRKTILAPAMVLAIFLTDLVPAMADSEPACPANTRAAHVQGTMKTNTVAPGETLVVAQLVVQGAGMLRCGLHGLATGPNGFTHTLACDDSAAVANSTDTVHSQLITSSQFVPPAAFQACATPAGAIQHSLNEISDPFFGHGAFFTAGGGMIYAQRSINCAGAVDIILSGTICLAK